MVKGTHWVQWFFDGFGVRQVFVHHCPTMDWLHTIDEVQRAMLRCPLAKRNQFMHRVAGPPERNWIIWTICTNSHKEVLSGEITKPKGCFASGKIPHARQVHSNSYCLTMPLHFVVMHWAKVVSASLVSRVTERNKSDCAKTFLLKQIFSQGKRGMQ